ncbi:DUF192 domain-containing protein [Pelagibaculum spongiae]|uniref:DUF192 domain-containing protein n=1 Tax=Pelagibaculum spongiae TaxID=2080658 RepID=A0A2V1GS69_9GAMM|nr:DUF192 domain-containing protein [Pelagibaculum spongiae]PVZ68239.1 hypothetical protein DC094_13155 [Pelagibaculum spongiae]
MTEILTLVLFLVNSSVVSEFNNLPRCQLISPQNHIIETRLANNDQSRSQGVSGLQPEQFSSQQGLLFVYPQKDHRKFWMPDTWFDLDLFCLDSQLTITDIQRNLPHHPSRKAPIPRAKRMECRYMLEMKANSPIAAALQPQQQLKQQGCF